MSALLTIAILNGSFEPLPPGAAKLLRAAPPPVAAAHGYVAGLLGSRFLLVT